MCRSFHPDLKVASKDNKLWFRNTALKQNKTAIKTRATLEVAAMFGALCLKHDAGMLADSSLMQDLNHHAYLTAGHPMCIYGDPAYPLRVYLQVLFKNAVLTPQMHAYNAAMSSVRISV